MLADGVDAMLEVGPHPVLVSMGQRAVSDGGVLWLSSLRRNNDDWRGMLEGLARLYVRGAEIDWQAFDRPWSRRTVSLPTYPFQRQRYWFELREGAEEAGQPAELARDADQWVYDVLWQAEERQPGIAAAGFVAEPERLAAAARPAMIAALEREMPPDEDSLLEELEEVCVDYVLAALTELGLELRAGATIETAATFAALRIESRHRRLFARMLAILGEAGVLRRDGDCWIVDDAGGGLNSHARADKLPVAPKGKGSETRSSNDQLAGKRIAEIAARYGRDSALLNVVRRCGPDLAAVLRGHVDPLTLLFPEDRSVSAERLYRDAPGVKVLNGVVGEIAARAAASAPQGRLLRILEIGAGTGATTASVLPRLPVDGVSYTFSDVSGYFLSAARKAFAGDRRLSYATLDIDAEPVDQGFEAGSYDVIIAANVVHATPDLRRSLGHVRQLLAPGGMLVLLEGMRPRRCLDLTFGLLEGWWAFRDTDLRPSYPLLSSSQWQGVLGECGFASTAVVPGDEDAATGLAGQRVVVARVSAVATDTPAVSRADGTWVICGDRSGFGETLADRLTTRGGKCIRVAEVRQAAKALGEPGDSTLRGVVFLGALDLDDEGAAPEQQAGLLDDALTLVRMVGAADGEVPLWFVTRGAQWAAGEAGPAHPSQASLWGLGQVVGLEQPGCWGGMVDLDPRGGDEQVELVAELLLNRGAETSIALRGGLALVPRLEQMAVREPAAEMDFGADATYLITGGLGAVGLEVARWMAEHGARRVALFGRRGLPARDAWNDLAADDPDAARVRGVRELERLGAQVTVCAVDVADRQALTAALDALRAQGRPIGGVIHAAGVAGAKGLLEIDAAELRRVLAPKLTGAWNLHELTRGDPLQFFVCFSSASSILGADEQGHYAAANRCLDALAARRRADGLCGLSVNWGRWGTDGMLTAEAHARFAQAGLRPMDPTVASELLGRLMAGRAAQVMVAAVDWEVFRPLYEARRARPLLSRIEIATNEAAGPAAEQANLMRELRAAPVHGRREMLAMHIEREVTRVLGMAADRRLDRSAGLFEIGMDSLMAVALRGRLQRQLGLELPKTLAFEHPSVDALTEFLLATCFAEAADNATLQAGEDATALRGYTSEPVAIVGASCRLPGGIDGLEAYWRLLRDGVDAVGEVPADRWDVDAWYSSDPQAQGRMYTRCGGFVGKVDGFDAQFFGISPREAAVMDPQQRLLLEVAWEALENAACAPAQLRGTRTGVFVGVTANDYAEVLAASGTPDAYYITGNSLNAVAGRLSYLLGLHGPSMVVDAACASSLVAVHLAVRSLRSGESDAVLAGGVNLILSLRGTVAACQSRMLSRSGRCRTFDAAADGFVRGEGCGVILLKRLSDAQAAGDRILAVIRGSAVGQDGASGGLTVPNAAAQQDVIRRAQDDAGVAPADIDYIEAHGTGTSLGDPIETRALAGVFGGRRAAARPIVLGSVKTNIGHLESASGIAGVIKVVLALQHGEIPRHLHLREVNPAIELESIPATIPQATIAWQANGRRRVAGVSSFGASGTLAHVVVEEGPVAAASEAGVERPGHVLTLSARTDGALEDLGRRVAEAVSRLGPKDLVDLCYTMNTGRSHFEYRRAIVWRTAEELRTAVGTVARGQGSDAVGAGFVERGTTGRVVFALEGASEANVAAVRDLCDSSPAMREAVQRCDRVLRQCGPGLLESLDNTNGSAQLRAAISLAVQWCVSQLWRSWGVEPAAVWDNGAATLAARCVAGAVEIEDALTSARKW